MQKIQPVILGIVTISVVVLFILHFTSTSTSNLKKEIKNTGKNIQTSSTIAYINVDSLLKKYKYYEELEKKITQRQQSMENDLNARMTAFEKEAEAFQHKVENNSFISKESAQRQQEELMAKQQNLYKLRDDLSMQLAQETQNLEKQLMDTVTNFLKQFNRNHQYSYILNHAAILYGSETMDITDTVAYWLNKRYEEKK